MYFSFEIRKKIGFALQFILKIYLSEFDCKILPINFVKKKNEKKAQQTLETINFVVVVIYKYIIPV